MSKNQNYTTTLNMTGNILSDKETPMKKKYERALMATNECSFWHFDETGEMLKEFEGFSCILDERITVTIFDSNNSGMFKLILMANSEVFNKLFQKFNVETMKEFVLIIDKEKSFTKLWNEVENIKKESIDFYESKIKDYQARIKRLKRK